jgi:putative selenium metabolism protein SsnA
MSDSFWITGGTVVTLDDGAGVIDDGAVKVCGTEIEWVGARADAGVMDGDVIDAGGRLILPGFINAHNHFYSTFACGLSPHDPPPANFKEILERLWWSLDKVLTLDDVRYSALVAMTRAIRAGVTTIIDHHASPNAVTGSLDAISSAANDVGVRCGLCYEVSNRDGRAIAEEGVAENASFLSGVKADPNGLSRGMFGLHASMTLDEDLLARCVEAMDRHDRGFHIHVCESEFDPADSVMRYGKRVVNRLADAGVLKANSICAHCIHLDDGEYDLLASTSTCVVHNPQSNMNNAVGRADIQRMLASGVCVGLGTDGMSATMLDDVRMVNLLHKHGTGDPREGFADAGRLLLKNNREIVRRCLGWEVGRLTAGAKADVVLMDYVPVTPLRAENFLGHLLFGLPTAGVSSVLVDGVWRLRDGVLTGVDERDVLAKAGELSAQMWERF